ncbi:hypothetical protein LJR219_000831 [Phenylobacterium sp. LjRoot219]|uniref:hypothetical protein n=1 Tax=Phenylobacterium sp. LjRoot219 TaxID=3342283 RepID=UPI003ED0DF91
MTTSHGDRTRSVIRRTALATAAIAALVAAAATPSGAAQAPVPVLATPAQIAAETTLLRLLQDPEIKAAQARLRAELATRPTGQTPSGAARIDEAIAQWTNSVIFKEIAAWRAPDILWGTDDTPRTWLGHTVGGVGTAGDNPDNIYRLAYLDGAGRYEILGQVDPAHRPAQLSLEIVRGDGGLPTKADTKKTNGADLGNQVAMLTDRDLAIGPDGRFRLVLGGADGGPAQVALPPRPLTVGIRDTLSDWSQRPSRLTIRRLDAGAPAPADPAELRRRVLAKLEDYVRFWSAFGDGWFGGLAPNSIGGPVARDGGWGFVSGVRFKLAPGEAILVTTTAGGASYTGFQATDPWMIAADATRHQTSLNFSQARPNADGSFTYVIAPTDPGVANWIDSAGLAEGYAVLRWQGLPPGATKDGLVRDFRLVRIAEIQDLPVPRVTPEQRRAQLAARADGYANRVR